ncbi:MAG: hypothetical protein AB7P20_18265 [Rhizobiaceae bacterium]
MAKTLGLALTQVASFCSVLGVYLTITPANDARPWWHWIVIALGVTLTAFIVFLEIREQKRHGTKTFKSKTKINKYMYDWVSNSGRALIFSRDMSWVNDEIMQLLLTKARHKELTICLEHPIEISDRLKNEGATIITYGNLGHVPRSRFTIVDFERDGARVAVGVGTRRGHLIQEFDMGAHPYFAVAEDLVKFLINGNAVLSRVPHS